MKWNWKWWKKKLPYYLDPRNDKVDGAYFQNAIPAAQWNALIDYVSQISGGDLSSFELKDDHELDIERIDGLIEALEKQTDHQADIKTIIDQLNASKIVYDKRFKDIENDLVLRETLIFHDADIAAVNKRIDDLPTTGGGSGDVTKEQLETAVNELQTSINTKENTTNHQTDITKLNDVMETKTAHASDIQSILTTTSNMASKNEVAAAKIELQNNINDLEKKTDAEFIDVSRDITQLTQQTVKVPTATNYFVSESEVNLIRGNEYIITLAPGHSYLLLMSSSIRTIGTSAWSFGLIIPGMAGRVTNNNVVKAVYGNDSTLRFSITTGNDSWAIDYRIWRLEGNV